MVFAVREPSDERGPAGLPELRLEGLGHEDARALLATVVPGRLDEHVRERIIAEAQGNPLVLLELPRGMSAAELAGGFGRPGAGSIEDGFGASWNRCPPPPGGCSSSRRPIPSASRCSCGAPPSSSASIRTPRPRPSTRGCWRSAPRCDSVTRACARRPTARRRRKSGRSCMPRWRRPRTRSSIPIGAHGTAPRRHRARRAGRRRARAVRRPCPGARGLAAAAAFLDSAAMLTPDPPAARAACSPRRAQARLRSTRCGAGAAARGRGGVGRRARAAESSYCAGRSPSTSAASPRPRSCSSARPARGVVRRRAARTTYLKAVGAAMWAGSAACPRRPRLPAPLRPARTPRGGPLVEAFAIRVTEG